MPAFHVVAPSLPGFGDWATNASWRRGGRDWTDCDGHPENAISRDRMRDMVSLYWLTGTAGSSARFYWENHPPTRRELVEVPVEVPESYVDELRHAFAAMLP
ncbi:hypothetical protein ACFT9I_02395 [Streptomyces sp. NPDC057137]|uniref:hypothetical protein n=1 Tax=Streptomyces sp. NPDC057137 TaxID=3346030 RepID=UPI00364483CF